MFTILAASYLVASMASEGLLRRFGPRVLAVGALTLATGHALLLAAGRRGRGRRGRSPRWSPGCLVIGAGMGLVIAPR